MAIKEKSNVPKIVGVWLLIGVIMVFVQVILGGITRLTDSGLSITEWNIIKGVLPPLNEAQWVQAFEKYQTHAKTQFEAIHADMTLSEFKYIYFWEWFHRLWARSMGFVFLFPFLFFVYKKMLPAALIKQLGLVILLAMAAATFGWIMVQSGLNTAEYAWVNAYKLTIHLSIAFMLLGLLWWICLRVLQPETKDGHNRRLRKFAWRITFIFGLQVVLGGIMSGMKAGWVAPHFPHMALTEDGSWQWVSSVLLEKHQWSWSNLLQYNKNEFAPALIQLLHRSTAYLLTVLILVFFFIVRRLQSAPRLKMANNILLLALIFQVTMGILTVMNSLNPSWFPLLGVLHQTGAMILMGALLFVNYQFSKGAYTLKNA